jgi:hypothetical protein
MSLTVSYILYIKEAQGISNSEKGKHKLRQIRVLEIPKKVSTNHVESTPPLLAVSIRHARQTGRAAQPHCRDAAHSIFARAKRVPLSHTGSGRAAKPRCRLRLFSHARARARDIGKAAPPPEINFPRQCQCGNRTSLPLQLPHM